MGRERTRSHIFAAGNLVPSIDAASQFEKLANTMSQNVFCLNGTSITSCATLQVSFFMGFVQLCPSRSYGGFGAPNTTLRSCSLRRTFKRNCGRAPHEPPPIFCGAPIITEPLVQPCSLQDDQDDTIRLNVTVAAPASLNTLR